MKQRLLSFLFFALLGLNMPVWGQIQISDEEELAAAIELFNTDGNDLTIEIINDIVLSKALPSLTANGTLTILGNGKTIDADVKEEDKDSSIKARAGQRRIFTIDVPTENSFKIVILDLTMTKGYNVWEVTHSNYGGAIYNTYGTLELVNCVLSDNSASFGGAIFNYGGNHTFSECRFINNFCNNSGGAIKHSAGTMMVSDCIFLDNKCGQSGGAIASDHLGNHDQPAGTYTNCLFDGNQNIWGSPGSGGAFYYHCDFGYHGKGPQFINCTFSATNVVTGNRFSYSKGGNILAYNRYLDDPEVEPAFYNCILENADNGWDMISGDFRANEYQEGFPGIIFQHCLTNVINDLDRNIHSMNNVYADDLLLDAEYVPLKGSPAIDSGDETFYNGREYDLSGTQKRIQGSRIDIGCFEATPRQISSVYHTLSLTLGGSINCNYSSGELTIAEGDHLYLQFYTDDPMVTAADILFMIDGEETTFNDNGKGAFNYILNPITRDSEIVIALREYRVTYPMIEGLTVNGASRVVYGESHTFSLTAADTLDLSEAIVLANGKELPVDVPGSPEMKYSIDRVTEHIEITIECIRKDPTSNAQIASNPLLIYVSNGMLIAESPSAIQLLSVYTLTGQLYTEQQIPAGTTRIALPAGMYIIRIGETTKKVVVN